jgi:hypothetical protein
MADLGITGLKTEVDVQIYTNHAQAITGAIMNDTLIDTIDTLKNGGNLDAKSVDTAQLADGAVTSEKLAGDALTELEIDIISNNIFNSDNLHRDALVGNDGDVFSAQGWQYALIDVEPGQIITFGRFSLGRSGYYGFYNGEPSLSTLVSVSVFDDPDGGVAATVTVPNGAKYLCIDIVSPGTIGGESPLFTANYGTILKFYDEYSEAITKINGVKLAGVEFEGTSMSYLVVDLPVSDGTGIESGYAYIDSTDRTVKVKE